MPVRWLVLLALFLSDSCGVPLGPLSTDTPPFQAVSHPLQPSKLFGPLITAPYPTNEWWQDAVLEDGDNPIFPEPYEVRLEADGVRMALNPKVIAASSRYMYAAFEFGLKLLFGEGVEHEVTKYDPLSLTAQYFEHKSRSPIAEFPIVRGSPYITAIMKAAAPVTIRTLHCEITAAHSNKNQKVNHKMPSPTLVGTVFTLALNTSQTWLVFTDKEVTLRWNATHITTAGPLHAGAVLRLAAIPAKAAAGTSTPLLTKYARCVPLGGQVTTDVSEAAATVRFLWRTSSPKDKPCAPLIVALPHIQRLLSKRLHSFTALQYDGLLGPLVGIAATAWAYRLPLANVSWTSPTPIREDMRALLAAQVAKDTSGAGFAPEPYAFGKQVCRYARVSLIAEELGLGEVMNKSDAVIKAGFESWLGGQSSDTIVYDATWRGAVPSNGLSSPGADFGAGYYNDHHFHYGYWLYAAAVVSKHDPEWGAKYAPHFTALARDIANPSTNDTLFPLYRYFDWYVGHSWASGLMAFTSGRNQESTSEAINAWYGMQLYGEAVGNPSLKRTGQVLLAHEMEAARVYWRSTSAHSVYPAEFAKHKGVGMIWENKVDVSTWFGAGPVYALAINILPYTPITEWYLRKDWVREAFPVMEQALSEGDYLDDWRVIVYMALAQVDQKAAAAKLKQLPVRSDEGVTLSNVMWWVATRPDPAQPDLPLPEAVEVPPPGDASKRPATKPGALPALSASQLDLDTPSPAPADTPSEEPPYHWNTAIVLATLCAACAFLWLKLDRAVIPWDGEGAHLLYGPDSTYAAVSSI